MRRRRRIQKGPANELKISEIVEYGN